MANKIKEVSLIAIFLFISGYLLNFFWESLHAAFFYEGHNFAAKKFVLMIAYVSMIDGLLILGIYFLVFILWRDVFWIKKFNLKQIISFLIIGFLIAGWIEYRAVFLLNKWSYNILMPTIFGLGLSPLIQLSITGLLSLLLTKRLINKK